jgi:hypothetical protein
MQTACLHGLEMIAIRGSAKTNLHVRTYMSEPRRLNCQRNVAFIRRAAEATSSAAGREPDVSPAAFG